TAEDTVDAALLEIGDQRTDCVGVERLAVVAKGCHGCCQQRRVRHQVCEHSDCMRRISELPASAELVVVGSGIVGASTAFFASRPSFPTLVLHPLPALCASTTAVAAGGYRLQLEHQEELSLVSPSVDLFQRFA